MSAGCCSPEIKPAERSTTRDLLECACVILAGVAMVAGAVMEARGATTAAWLAFGASYVAGGYFGVLSAARSLREGDVDIDLLMLLAAIGAAVVGAPFEGALLLFLFALSNVLQTFALGRNHRAIEGLAKLRPTIAHVIRNGKLIDAGLEEIAIGEHILLRPGEQVPLDARVIEGESTLDQSSVTGESLPITKRPGSELFAGTQNLNGSLTAEVLRMEKDSTLARMITLVEDAQRRKARAQRFLEEAEQRYAMGVIAFTILLILGLPTVFGLSWSDGFYRAITVMVVASPCALVISTPATILAAIANGARHGILFKGGAQLEKASRIRAVAFDKTGTLTRGRPEVIAWAVAVPEEQRAKLLEEVGSVEAHSEHPLGQALVRHAKENGGSMIPVNDFRSDTGRGVTAKVGGRTLTVGKLSWLAEDEALPEGLRGKVETWRADGHTLVGAAEQSGGERRILAVFAIADPVRLESTEVIARLRRTGVRRITMLTGDSATVARSIGERLGLDEVHADLLPEDKVRRVAEMSAKTETAMVGDGTNDAPALASASLGIAMGAAGSDIAMESADVVLMANDLHKVGHVLALSRQAHRIVLQNLVFAGGIIVLMVMATLLLPLAGLEVPLPLGVLAHEGGTVLVCLNGLRLLGFQAAGN